MRIGQLNLRKLIFTGYAELFEIAQIGAMITVLQCKKFF